MGWGIKVGIAVIELGDRGCGWVVSKARRSPTLVCSILNDRVHGRRGKQLSWREVNMRKEPRLSENVSHVTVLDSLLLYRDFPRTMKRASRLALLSYKNKNSTQKLN